MILSIDGMEFSYGRSKIIGDVGFSAGKGDIISIMGPNGVGKTTLLKCINKILNPSAGTVSIDGLDADSMSGTEIAKKIGYVPQNSETSSSKVFDAVLLGRRPYIGYSIGDRDIALTGRVIDRLGLTHLSEKRMDQISGGERQMVNIARAIVQQPKAIILDEPTNNLDPKNQHKVMRTVEDLVSNYDMCAVMTNHDINLSLRYCNKFIMMAGGGIYCAGDRSVVNSDSIREVYGIEAAVEFIRGIPVLVPL